MIPDQEPAMRIRLLGSFEVSRGERVLGAQDWQRKKAAMLLKRLAYEGRLIKDQAIEFLWPESDPDSGANNLYRALHSLRQTLATGLGPDAAGEMFSFRDGILQLNDPVVWVDTDEFEHLCQAAPGLSPEQRTARLEAALALYRGDFLSDDRYEEWTQLPREELSRRHREASLARARQHMEWGDYPAAIELLSPRLLKDPADELLCRELMRLHALSGRRQEALRLYQACVEALKAEIEAPPSPETTALYRQILNTELEPAPPVVFPVPAGSPTPAAPTPPLFVGREQELQALFSHFQAAIRGEGGVLFIAGEAGQGKTSLMVEFAHRALNEQPEVVIASGACQALIGFADPYSPFRDLIAILSGDWQRPWPGSILSEAQVQRLRAIGPQVIHTINTHAPDLADIFLPQINTRRPVHQRRDLDQRQIFAQMEQLLRRLATRQPIVLLLDDLQWIDAASANLLFYLGRQLANSPVLVIGAYRPSELSQQDKGEHPLTPVIQELIRYRGEILIDLDTIGPAEGRSFIDALLDSEPNHLDASFREALYRRTKGHPLFTVELLRALQDQGSLEPDKLGRWVVAPELNWDILPARVEAVISRRIEVLPEELRQVLATACVEGESFSVEVVAHVQSQDPRDLLRQLSQELDRRYRLVHEQGEWRLGKQLITRYQFRHHLFQQYLYHQLSSAERRALHGEIAAALEQIGREEIEPLTVTLAQHFLAAGDAARAVPYLCRAGDDARRRVALEETVHFYGSALENWQGKDLTARAEVLKKLGETYLALGKSAEAVERLVEAERIYAGAGSHTHMGGVHRLIGRAYWEQGVRAKALTHYHRALALLEEGPENVEQGHVISSIAQMHMLADEYEAAISWGERALRMGRALEAEDVITNVQTTMGVSLTMTGEVERGLAMLAESQARAEQAGLPHEVGRAYAGWGDTLVNLERYEEARTIYERLLAYAQKVQASMFEGVALAQLGHLDWWTGRWRQARERVPEIWKWMSANPGSSMAKVWASNLLGLVYNDLGQTEKALASLVPYTEVARSAAEPQTTIPHLTQLARCTPSQAERSSLMEEILALLETASYPRYETLPALLLPHPWPGLGSIGNLASLSRIEEALYPAQNRQLAACLAEARASEAGIREEWEEAAAHYQAAAENWRSLNRPYDLLRSLTELRKAVSMAQRSSSFHGDIDLLAETQEQSVVLVEQLANQLDEPEGRRSFLNSPLVKQTLQSQPGKNALRRKRQEKIRRE